MYDFLQILEPTQELLSCAWLSYRGNSFLSPPQKCSFHTFWRISLQGGNKKTRSEAENSIEKSDDNQTISNGNILLWDHTNQTNDHHSKQNKKQDISSGGSTENSEISEQDVSNGEESQNGDLKSDSELDPSSQDRFNLDAEAHEYHDEHLRFLVHNTTADGIHFMLTAIKM